MPINTEIYEAQNNFNREYGVKFDIDEFDGSIDGLNTFGGRVDANEIYRASFFDLYKKAYANFVDRKIGGTFDCVEMLKKFEQSIMEPYRKSSDAEYAASIEVYGNWKGSEYLARVKRYLDNEIPSGKKDYAAQRYDSRELKIRDIRAYLDNLQSKEGEPSNGELSTLDCYLSAISTAHKNRSALWMISHPFRYFAEQRCINTLTSYLVEKTGGNLSASENAKYSEVSKISEDKLIEVSREAVNRTLEEAKKNEESRISDKKEEIHESNKKEEILESNKKERVYIDPALVGGGEKTTNITKEPNQASIGSLNKTN